MLGKQALQVGNLLGLRLTGGDVSNSPLGVISEGVFRAPGRKRRIVCQAVFSAASGGQGDVGGGHPRNLTH